MEKETIYDERISPLMAQVIAICKDAGIACFATFDISTEDDPGFFCTTCLPDGDGKFPDAIKDCEHRLYRPNPMAVFTVTKSQ